MFLSTSLSAALDRIAERAADVRRAYTPAAVPQEDDVASGRNNLGLYARSARRDRAGRHLLCHERRSGKNDVHARRLLPASRR